MANMNEIIHGILRTTYNRNKSYITITYITQVIVGKQLKSEIIHIGEINKQQYTTVVKQRAMR